MLSTEDIINIYHGEIFKHSKGFYPKRLVDYSKYEDTMKYFENFKQFINRNDTIDIRQYVRSLAVMYNGWFHPKELSARSSIKVYLSYIKSIQDSTPVVDQIKSSVRFIINFCKTTGISSYDDYIIHNSETFPTLLKHINNGSVSYYLLAYDSDLEMIMSSFPCDVVQDFCSDWKRKLLDAKRRVFSDVELRKLSGKLFPVIDFKIKEEQKGNE